MIKFVNMTPHTINYVKADGSTLVLESAGLIRCASVSTLVETLGGEFLVYHNSYKLEEELPSPQEGVYYIVPALVTSALSGKRDDILVVNNTVRDEAGHIVGCNSFARI